MDFNGTIKLYHGSRVIVNRPVYGQGKPYNDYGLGFYCTESAELAKEWAANKDSDGYANAYEMDCTGLKILDLNAPQYSVMTWLAILLENRRFDASAPLAHDAREYILANFMVDYQSADCIIGYRADDSYFAFASDFISGTISYRQLGNAMKLGKLGQQFVLKSEKAFKRIHFIGAEPVPSNEWYARRMSRDRAARHEYLDIEHNRRQRGDLYIATIMDEEMKMYDPRL